MLALGKHWKMPLHWPIFSSTHIHSVSYVLHMHRPVTPPHEWIYTLNLQHLPLPSELATLGHFWGTTPISPCNQCAAISNFPSQCNLIHVCPQPMHASCCCCYYSTCIHYKWSVNIHVALWQLFCDIFTLPSMLVPISQTPAWMKDATFNTHLTTTAMINHPTTGWEKMPFQFLQPLTLCSFLFLQLHFYKAIQTNMDILGPSLN